MKTTTIRKRMMILFGTLLLIAFFVVFLFSRIALQLYMTNARNNNFEEEIKIITSVFKEEFVDAKDDTNSTTFVENIRSGKRRVGFFDLDSEIEIITNANGKIRQITGTYSLSEKEITMINNTIANKSFGDLMTIKREVDGALNEFKVLISPISLVKNQEPRFYAIMYVSVQDEIDVLKKFSRVLLVILLSVYMVTLIGVYMVTSNITKPIVRMKQFANRLGSGEEPEQLKITTKDELQDLGNTLNTMASDIINSNEEQLRFLQNASHELKTPLTSIQGYAEGMMDGVITDDTEALTIIIDESIRLKKIVNQLSLLSKLETGVKTFKKEEVNLIDCINDVVNKINIQTNDNISIVLNYNRTKDYLIKGDYDGFVQSFLNVLSNGLRYCDKEIEIIVTSHEEVIEVSFIDDGLGIKEAAIPHLFERFYKGNKGDTGLGLAIVKAITEQQNGKIEVYNSADKGAVFKFLFQKS